MPSDVVDALFGAGEVGNLDVRCAGLVFGEVLCAVGSSMCTLSVRIGLF